MNLFASKGEVMHSRLRHLLLGTVLVAVAGSPAWAQEPPTVVEAPVVVPPQVEPAAPAVAEEMDALSFVTWASASVRTSPTGTAPLAETLPFGSQVIVTGRMATGGWVRVQTPKTQVGYMWAQTLAPMRIALPGAAATPETPTAPVDESADDTVATATPLGALAGAPLVAQGRVSREDETDVYSFTVQDWTNLEVRLSGLSGDADIDLRNSDDQSIGSSALGGSESEKITTQVGPGTYYVVVTSYGDNTPYRLSVAGTPGEAPPPDSAGNSQSDAKSLGDVTTSGAEASEWVGPADNTDYFSFEITERRKVTLTLDGLSADADINLEGADGSYLASGTNVDAEPESISATLEPGTYYINVYAATGAATPYRLAVSTEEAPPAPPDHAGNTPNAAGTIENVGPTPVTVNDWVGFTDRDDYWRFTLASRADVTVQVTMESADVDVDLLRASDETNLISGANSGTDPEELKLRLDPGTYLLRVYSYQGDTPYSMQITAVPAK